LYDDHWWVASVIETSEIEQDVKVSFMHPHGPARSFRWPAHEDICWVPMQNILHPLNPPTTANGRLYHLEKKRQGTFGQKVIKL